MSSRPEQPEPFLRGCVFPAVTDAPYPRADPAGAEYLPADVWDAAQLPVGVRLELAGNARTIRVWYKTTRASLGYRGESAGCSFVAYRAGQKVANVEAVMGEGMAELALSGRSDLPVTVYLPEGMQPLITGVAGVEETMVPAPPQPRWLAYGDAVTQGWLASAPAMAWPAVAGRKLGLDVCNLGYAGTARGESTSAVLLAETPAEVISIAFGLNNWSRVPHTAGLMSEEVRCFLAIVRKGHPDVPIVVVSPTARPDAEDSPNRVGATLAELRLAMEAAVLDWIGEGDKLTYLVEGLNVVDPEDLEDGIYPGDEGHRRLAAAVAKVLVPHLSELQEAARIRWTKERLPGLASVVSAPVETRAAETGPVDAGSLDLPLVDEMAVETDPTAIAPVDTSTAAPELFDIEEFDDVLVTAEAVAAEPVEAEAVAEPVDGVPVEDVPASGNWWADEAQALTGDVFDPTPPTGSPVELDFLEDELENVSSRNLDLPDAGSLGRESLNNALLDALSSNGPSPSGSFLDDAAVGESFAEDSFAEDPLAEDSFVEDPYGEESFANETFDAETFGPEAYADQTFVDQTFVDQTYAEQTYAQETFVESFTDDSLFDGSSVDDSAPLDDGSQVDGAAVDDGRAVDGSFAEYPTVDDYSYVDDVPVLPVVVPTLEDTLAAAAAAAPAELDPISDATPVAVPPFPAPEFDDSSFDADPPAPPSVDPAAAPVETAAVETVETAPVERAAVAVPSPTSALNGEVPVIPATNGTTLTTTPTSVPVRNPAAPVRRETGHVDIAVADMVVAALTLATNGADDVIYGHGPDPAEGLHWAEASDPGSF